jgi:hypothetical protein
MVICSKLNSLAWSSISPSRTLLSRCFTFSSKVGTWVAILSTVFLDHQLLERVSQLQLELFFRAAFSFASSDFKATRDLAAKSWSPGSTPSVVNCSMKHVIKESWSQSRILVGHDKIHIDKLLTCFFSALCG